MDISDPRYGKIKNFIADQIADGLDLNTIKFSGEDSQELFECNFSQFCKYTHFNVTLEEWYELVMVEWDAYKNTLPVEPIFISSESSGNLDVIDNLTLPTGKRSAWQRYKNNLREVQKFDEETINNVEGDSYAVLQQLKINTTEIGPVKGMVVGSVQSGKTTNMAALIAQAADNGFNIFIVLSGIIENLRVQTLERLYGDLNPTSGEVNWNYINRPLIDGDFSERPENLQLNSTQKYIMVCLKQKNRLTDLLKWLTHDPNMMKNMKILLIDDEADQASVNTVNVDEKDRRAINSLIVNIVENRMINGKDAPVKYRAMNYVGYTATPYANVLTNESKDSLYPKNFISVLARSKQYFGPTEIFGLQEVEGEYEGVDGLDIIRYIDDVEHNEDVSLVRDLEKGKLNKLPVSLKKAIGYYIGACASLRIQGYKKSLSMLVHSSSLTSHHANLYKAISSWLKNDKNEVIQYVNKYWNEEIDRFNLVDFKLQYPHYTGDLEKSYKQLNFEQIKLEVEEMLGCVAPAKLDEDGIVNPNSGITLSLDNSNSSQLQNDNEYLRVKYNNKKEYAKAPVYLVVGGATLSRGLTLEGLITSYFLRSGSQADTLMQMGRWFGYRRNIELYPRIWISKQTKTQFEYLSALDYELRKEIYNMQVTKQDFSKIGPKLKNSPKTLGLRLSSKNRMLQAEATNIDFTGTNIQTYIFDKNIKTLKHNKESLERLLEKLAECELIDNGNNKSVTWRNVPFNNLVEFLIHDYKYCDVQRSFGEMELFRNWVEELTSKGKLKNWNVVFVSLGDAKLEPSQGSYKVGKYYINMVDRSMKKDSPDGLINLGVLSGPGDVYRDIDINKVDSNISTLIKKRHSKDYQYVRQSLNMEEIPLLVLYLVNGKTSKPVTSPKRVALDLDEDIFGFNIFIPNGKSNDRYDTYLRVKMPDYGLGKEDILDNEANEN